jgi:hypothetical protein
LAASWVVLVRPEILLTFPKKPPLIVSHAGAIAILGFLAWFLIRRRRKAAAGTEQQQQQGPQTPQPFQQQHFGSPGGPHPPVTMMQQQQHPQSPPLYDPRMSTFKPSPESYAAPAAAAGGHASVSPTGSPPIPYDQHNSYYGGDQVSPAQQGYPPQQYQQPYQQQQQQQYQQPYQPYQPQQQQQYGAVPPQGRPPQHGNAVELPSTRPDGELRELA